MRLKTFILMGLTNLLFGCKTPLQKKLIDITSKTEEGFQDIVLSIVEKKLDNDFWIIIAKGNFKDTIVGIKIKIMNGIKPGIIGGDVDRSAFIKNGVEISTIGKESDNFVKILSKLYGIATDKKFTSNPIQFTCFSLNSTQAFLDKNYFKFKLFYDDTDENGLYSELYLNPDFQNGLIEIPEKDPEYRENLIKTMTR